MTPKQIKNLRAIIISFVLFVVLMIVEHTGLITSSPLLFVLYLIPYFIVGWNVVRKALLSIKNRQAFDESFLMTLATVGAFVTQEFGEAVAVMLFYQIGEWFQDYAVNRSRKSIAELMDIAPEEASREVNGEIEVIDPDDVEIGDILVIKPGEKVPVDGVVIEGHSMVNTSALTGESVPRSVNVGDTIISGCINDQGLLKIRAEKDYDNSTVSKILELVEEAAEKKSPTENFISKFARYYTPIVVIGALLLAFIPPLFVGDFLKWMYRACTFLVISCPCALVISVPLSFFGGIGASSKKGILVKGSNYLEVMDQVKVIVSDKTGTLTKGTFKVTHIDSVIDDDELLYYASLLESMSTHPIATSIKQAYGKELDTTKVNNIENIAGQGIKGIVDGKEVLVGNDKMMKAHHIEYTESTDLGSTIVYVAIENKFVGTLSIADEMKEEAPQAIKEMKQLGVEKFIMLTGDRKEAAEAMASKMGVDEVYAELLPEDKVNKVEEILKNTDGKVAFIGDGINDAPVLTRSDVGIAMGSMGSDAAIEAADIVIMDDNLERLAITKRIARKTLSISKQNIVFALAIKVLILILGALGYANMWAAVFADVGVAFICILNAMRTLNA